MKLIKSIFSSIREELKSEVQPMQALMIICFVAIFSFCLVYFEDVNFAEPLISAQTPFAEMVELK